MKQIHIFPDQIESKYIEQMAQEYADMYEGNNLEGIAESIQDTAYTSLEEVAWNIAHRASDILRERKEADQ